MKKINVMSRFRRPVVVAGVGLLAIVVGIIIFTGIFEEAWADGPVIAHVDIVWDEKEQMIDILPNQAGHALTPYEEGDFVHFNNNTDFTITVVFPEGLFDLTQKTSVTLGPNGTASGGVFDYVVKMIVQPTGDSTMEYPYTVIPPETEPQTDITKSQPRIIVRASTS